MDLGIPPLTIKNVLESHPLKSRFLVCGPATAAPSLQCKICAFVGSSIVDALLSLDGPVPQPQHSPIAAGLQNMACKEPPGPRK